VYIAGLFYLWLATVLKPTPKPWQFVKPSKIVNLSFLVPEAQIGVCLASGMSVGVYKRQ